MTIGMFIRPDGTRHVVCSGNPDITVMIENGDFITAFHKAVAMLRKRLMSASISAGQSGFRDAENPIDFDPAKRDERYRHPPGRRS